MGSWCDIEGWKNVEKCSEQNGLWYLDKELVVTGHQCWLTKISHSKTTPFPFFYGDTRLINQKTMRDTVFVDVSKTFNDLSIAL